MKYLEKKENEIKVDIDKKEGNKVKDFLKKKDNKGIKKIFEFENDIMYITKG